MHPPMQSVHPQAEQESTFFLRNWGDLDVGRGYLGSLTCVLRATTKRRSTFSRRKSAPQRKSWLRLYDGSIYYLLLMELGNVHIRRDVCYMDKDPSVIVIEQQ